MKVIIYFYVVFFSTVLLSCNDHESPRSTLLNNVEVSLSTYMEDSVKLLSLLRKNLVNKVPPFSSKEYFDSTILSVDTILYNLQMDKVAFFVIAKNPTKRLADPDTRYDYYYDSFCFLGRRLNLNSEWNISWFSVFNIVTYYNLGECRNRIRYKYFQELAEIKDTLGAPYYKYNLNDKRFWEGVAWK